ncbi:hypothetical protein [Vibrio sp. C8]
MAKELRVRSQMLNPETGKFIKAIDERDLSDFLALIAPRKEVGIVHIPDMTPAILEVKKHVEYLFERKEKTELSITHSVIFNLWNKAKVSKKETVKEKLNIEVLKESEKALNLIHTRIPDLKRNYLSPKIRPNDWGYEQNLEQSLEALLAEVQVFIEIVLCHIHSSAIIEPSLVSEPSVLEHCQAMYSLLEECLRNEADVSVHKQINISKQSFIYQCCLKNDLDLNPIALLYLLGIPQTQQDIINKIISSSTRERRYDNLNRAYDVNVIEWEDANTNKTNRARKIIKLMQQLVGILSLFETFENNDVEYDEYSNAFEEIKQIVSK